MKADAALSDIPVILVTANAQPISYAHANENSQIDAYLAKPFRAQELLDVVDNILSQHHEIHLPRVERQIRGRKYSEDLAEVDN